jgi:hypothetical protein
MPMASRELSPVAVASALATAWTAAAGALLLGWTPLSVVLGFPLALVVPGRLVVTLLRRTAQGLERWVLAVGSSLAVLVACVAVTTLLPGGTSSANVASTLAVATALLGALAVRSTRGAPVTVGPIAFGHPLRLVRVSWVGTGLIVTACIAGALTVSVATEQSTYAEPLTQLSLVPGGGGFLLEVHNLEGAETTYRLEVDLPGATRATRNLTLADRQTHTEVLQSTADGQVVVRLFGGSATALGYRQVTAATD